MTFEACVPSEHIEDHPRTLILVFEMRRMDQNLLLMLDGQFHVF